MNTVTQFDVYLYKYLSTYTNIVF